MLDIQYSAYFLRKYHKIKKRDSHLALKLKEKIELLGDRQNHKALGVHKLKTPYLGYYSFSVNYQLRIISEYGKNKEIVILLTVGGHDDYL